LPVRALARVARSLAAPLGAILAARFAIGCLVVTFALLAHTVHDLGDTTIGLLYSALTVPFAAATYPAARLGARVAPALLLGAGAVVWGAGLLALGWAPTWALLPVMIVAGLASAAMFAPVLGYAAQIPDGRASAMALVNAAGALGMLLGPLAAGVTIAVARRQGAAVPYRGPFVLAAIAVAVWLVASAPWIARQSAAFVRRDGATARGKSS
jgi:MFS family permease